MKAKQVKEPTHLVAKQNKTDSHWKCIPTVLFQRCLDCMFPTCTLLSTKQLQTERKATQSVKLFFFLFYPPKEGPANEENLDMYQIIILMME